ncbi:phosphotransferase (plasmid) [Mycolicibacterium aichiense]|uniref:phosphotransferase n=1 Tax=Mycolicibacterium aichiense TaxID=1799 RepID=UPI003D66E069
MGFTDGWDSFADGWDSFVAVVDGRWVDRRPRRPEVAGQLRRETQLMPWLAPLLPLQVPVPWIREETPLVVRHVLVPGRAIAASDVVNGRVIGRFLHALHHLSPIEACRHGLASAGETRRRRAATISRLRGEVMPLIPVPQRNSGALLLDAVQEFPIDTIVHGDFGPDHVLVGDGQVTGVIDFGDVHLGDAANDLAWPLFGAPPAIADAVVAAYGVTADLGDRALVWHQLGPWHEVTHGLDIGDPDTVQRGVKGVLARLNRPKG